MPSRREPESDARPEVQRKPHPPAARGHACDHSSDSSDSYSWLLAHLVYSHQYAQWSGTVTGGLISGDSCATLCFLDHDQRDTVVAGTDVSLPWKSALSFNVIYGSGFLDGDGPAHLPWHMTFDLGLRKTFGERLAVNLTVLNLTDDHYLLDNSNTFGGTHFANPREIFAQLTYRFHY